jgi:hypothetical protein
MDIGVIKGPDGTLVYVTLVSTPADLPGLIEDLPEGGEPTGVIDKAVESVEQIKKTIASIVSVGAEAIKQHAPSEWTIQFEIGFKGKTNPVPILVSSEAQAVLKISAKWTKS